MKKSLILILLLIFLISCSNKNVDDSKLNDNTEKFIQGKCMEVISGHNDINGKKLNVVFIGIEVKGNKISLDEGSFDFNYLEKRSKKLMESILSIEPYKSNKELINFWDYSEILQEELIIDEKTGNSRLDYNFDKWSDVIKDNCGIIPTQIELVIHHKEMINGADQMMFVGEDGKNVNFSISIIAVYDIKDIESYVNRPLAQSLDHELVFHQLGYTPWHDYLTGNNDFKNNGKLLNKDKKELLIGANAVCYEPTSETLSEEEAINECKQKSGWHDLIGNGCGKDRVIDCEEDDVNYYNEISCYKGCAESDKLYRPLKYNLFLQGDDKTKDYSFYDFTVGEQKMRKVCNKIKDYIGEVKGVCNILCLEGCDNKCVDGVCV